MGHSNTIDQQTKANAEFQKYVDAQTAALDGFVTQAQADIAKSIEDYYTKGGWNDAKPLISGTYQHVTTTSEWSLQAVADMISKLQTTMFGGAPTQGASAPPQSDDLKEAVAKMGGMEALITSAAFEAIEGVLEAFTSGTQTSVQKKYDVKELAPGLTLFLCVIENQYHRSDFVSDNTIVQNAYVFDTRFSIKQGADIARFDEMTNLKAQQDAQEAMATKCNALLVALDPAADDYEVKAAKYEGIQAQANVNVEKLRAAIEALLEKKALAAAAAKG